MNKLKEIFDQLKDALMVRWEQFSESDTYIQLRDRYENLSPRNQKATIIGSVVVVALMIFSIPYSWFSVSRDSVTQFEDTKNTIQELLQVSQEAKSIPPDGQGMTMDDVKTRVDKVLSEKGLTKEQIISVVQGSFVNPQGTTLLPPQVTASGVDVNLHKLNLKQIVDIGYEFDHLAPLVKTLNVEIKANADDVHYYDVGYRVATFAVKDVPSDSKKPGTKTSAAPKGEVR